MAIIATGSLIQLANHFKGSQALSRPQPKVRQTNGAMLDLADIRGRKAQSGLSKSPLPAGTIFSWYLVKRNNPASVPEIAYAFGRFESSNEGAKASLQPVDCALRGFA